MSRRLSLELLQKVKNPSHMFTELEADEDGVSKLFTQLLIMNNGAMHMHDFG